MAASECGNRHPEKPATTCDKAASNHRFCTGWCDQTGGFVDWPNPGWTPAAAKTDLKSAESGLRAMAAKLGGAEGSERAAKSWSDAEQLVVEAAITEAAEKHSEFTADAVWAVLGDRVKKTAGMAAMLKRVERKGFISKTDKTADSTRERGDHDAGRRLTVWKSLMR
jgi:hypothetical protein